LNGRRNLKISVLKRGVRVFPLPSRERVRVRGHDRIHAPSPHSSPVEGEEDNLFALTGSLEETGSCRTQRNFRSRVSRGRSVSVVLVFAVLAGCQQKMADQPRYEPLSRSTFFNDGRAARPLVEGTVARGQLGSDAQLYTGKEGGKWVDTFPFPVTLAVLSRGQQRFNIFCAPCHDRVGTGQGTIVRRGYRAPPSFHIDRLRQAPAGYFFDAMTNGFGVMPDYAQQVHPEDRWAIVAYIRALQLSQHATLADVPEDQRRHLESKP
jgi:mono/diheme cytochrome c family protein